MPHLYFLLSGAQIVECHFFFFDTFFFAFFFDDFFAAFFFVAIFAPKKIIGYLM
jgi:hypothetical protein